MAGLNIGDVFMRVLADMTGFEADVTKQATKAGDKAGASLGSRMSKGVTVGLTAVGAAAGTIFTGALGGAANFEDQLRTINTVAKLTDDELHSVGNNILDLSKETGRSTDDLTAGFYDLVSAGIPAGDAIKVLKDSAILAEGALGTTAETVDLLTSAINAYGLEAKDSTRVSDIFAQAVADGKVTAAELGSTLANIAPVASSAGVSLEEVAAGYAVLTAKGVPAAQAATQMRAAISALLTPNAQLNKLQAQTGINFAKLAEEKGLAVALEAVRKATNGNNDAFAKALGSIEAYQFAVQTTGDAAGDFQTELDKVTKAAQEGGVAQGQYDERMKSAAAQGRKFAAGLRATAIQLAGPFVDSLGGAVIALNELGGGMGGLVNLSRLFGGALGGVAGFLGSKLGPRLKDGLAKVFSRLIIPSSALTGIGESMAEGVGDSLTKGVAKQGLAKRLAKAVGTIAIPIAFTFLVAEAIAQFGQEQIEKDAKPKIAELTEKALTEGTKEGLEKSISQLRSIAHNAGRANPTYGEWVEAQIAPLQEKLDKLNGVVVASTDGIGRGVEASLGKQQDDVARGAEKMMSGVGAAGSGAKAKGASLGSTVASGVAQGLYDVAIQKQSVVQNAFKLLLSASQDTMHKVDEINYLVGVLTSKELARGLTDTRESVRVAAQETRAAAEARLAELRFNAGNIGKKTNEELAKGLKSKDPQVRAAAQRTKALIEAQIKSAKTRAAGQTAGQNVANGLTDKRTAVGNAAWRLGVAIYQSLIHSVQFSQAHHTNPKPPERRAGGGATEAGEIYVVGEHGQELFVPKTDGTIIPNDKLSSYSSEPTRLADGQTVINLETYGLPMRAETPAEVAAQLRRVGRVAPRKRLSWAPS